MDTLITLNFIGYAAVLAGGALLGTMFGRRWVSDAETMLHVLESRVAALESTLRLGHLAAGVSSDSATEAIKSHAMATEKLAIAIESHAASAVKA